MMPTRKLAGPGLFRFLLANLVFVHHASRFAIGTASVYIFFCLSGFWICRMWRARYSQTANAYVTYLISRAWRLIPTFMLIAAISWTVELALGRSVAALKGSTSWLHVILSHVFILGYDSLSMQPMVPAWSLDFEVQFYLLAPLIIVAILRSKHWLLLLAGTGLLSLASAHWIGPHVLSSYLVFFIIGMIASERNWRPSGRRALLFSTLGFALLAVCILSRYRGVLLIGAHPGPFAIYNQPLNVVFALLIIPFAIYTTRQTGFAMDGMFADLSYIVYLLHWAGMQALSLQGALKVSRVTLTALVFLAVYVLGYVIWKFYDRPINQLRSKWVSGRKLNGSRSVKAVAAEVTAP